MSAKNNGRAGPNPRSFIQVGAAAIGASGSAFGSPKRETLALNGGSKAVTLPRARAAEISKWPRYGENEKKIVVELLENNRSYSEIPLLEKELQDYLKAPYVKAHCNGTSALISLFFALDLVWSKYSCGATVVSE